MIRHIKLAGFIAALLVILLPSFTLAQDVNFSVSPAEVHIDNLPPGEAAEFELTIHNKEELAHNFTIAAFQPSEEERRKGRAEFPDNSWISFSSQKIEVAANSAADVTVTVAIPREQQWADWDWDWDWEIWLGAAAESSDLLAVRLYVRLLISTSPAADTMPNAGLVAGIIVGLILLGWGGYYYFRRKARPE